MENKTISEENLQKTIEEIVDVLESGEPISARRYLPTFAELCDFLSIKILKTIFIPAHKKEYEKEITDLLHDIDLLIEQKNIKLTSKMVRALQILMLSMIGKRL